MLRLDSIPVLAWAILALAAWRSSALLHAWQHSPLDRLGWLALLIWCLPAAAFFATSAPPPESARHHRLPLLAASLAAILGGALGDVNAANYLGLALAIAALPGLSLRHALWFMTALSWMPALSWAAKGLPRDLLVTGRLLLAATGCVLVLARRSGHPDPAAPATPSAPAADQPV